MAALVTNLTQLSGLAPSSMTLATVGGAGGSIPRQGSLGIKGVDGVNNGNSLYFDGATDSSSANTHYSAWISLATAGNGYDLSADNQAVIAHFAQQNTQYNNYKNASDSMWMILFSDGGTTNYARWHFNVHDYLDGNWHDIVMTGTPDATGGTFNDADVTGWGIAVEINGASANEYGFSFVVDQLIYVDGEIVLEDTGVAAAVTFESYYDKVYRYSGTTFHNLSNVEIKPAWAFGYPLLIQSDNFNQSNYTQIFLPNTETEGSFTVSTTGYYSLTIRPDNSAATHTYTDGVHAYDSGTYDLTIDSVNLTTGSLTAQRVTYLNTRNVTIGGNSLATVTATIPSPTGTVDISDVLATLTITNTATPIQWTADLDSGSSITTDSDIDITFAGTNLNDIDLILTDVVTISVDPTGASQTYYLGGIVTSSTLKLWNKDTSNATTIEVPSGITTQKIDLWFNYDGESGGPFTVGETLTFGNGATATLRTLTDNGTTGTMYCTYIAGTTPPDNNSITGGTSGATALVNAASGASKSTLTITQTPVTYTFNSDTASTLIRYFEDGSQTVVDSVTGTTLDYDFPDADPVDVEFVKQGYVPVNRQNVIPTDGGTLDIIMDVDEAYNASHGLTITSQYDYNRSTKVLTINSDQEALDVRSSLADVIRTNSGYYNTALLMVAIPGLTRIDLTNGMTITSMATWKGAGMERFDAADSTNPVEKWVAIKSVGNITGASAYYRQTSSGNSTSVTLTNNVINEAFQYWSDPNHDGSTADGYDRSGYFVIKTFLAGTRQARADVVASSGLAALKSNLYTVALANAAHDYAGTDPGISADLTLIAGGTEGGVAFSYEIVDGGTNTGADIADQLHYNRITTPNSVIPGGTGLRWWELPDMVIYNATSVETERGYREGATPTLVGFYVSRGGVDHPSFTRFQGDDGTYYTPTDTVQYTAPNLLNGTRVLLYNVTADVEIDNDVVSGGGGYAYTLTPGVDFTSGDVITLLATYQSAGVAKRVFRNSATVTTADIVASDSQVDWTNPGPNVLGIDGSTVSECATDYVGIQVEVTDSDDTTHKSRIAAFIVNALTTADGIRNWVGLDGSAVITYSTNTAAQVDASVAAIEVINVKTTSTLSVKDSFEFDWSDGVDRVSAILGSSIIWITPARVLLEETGVSGLTAGESAQLAVIASVDANVDLLIQDSGLDSSNPKTITENTEGTSYDETFGAVTKEIRRTGSSTTITRTA